MTTQPDYRPVVGVTTSRQGGRYMWWGYWLALLSQGERPVRLVAPGGEATLGELDGLIIGGGDDLSAEIYRGDVRLDVRIDPARDRMELKALDHVVPRGVPVLGICRGAQMLNVFHGGTLHQSIHAVFEGLPRLWTPLPRKKIRIEPNSRLHAIMGPDRIRVNSLHNQSIDRVGRDLTVSAHDEFGIVQAIERPGAGFQIGVQWHPEFMIYSASQRRLFRAFLDAVKRRATQYRETETADAAP